MQHIRPTTSYFWHLLLLLTIACKKENENPIAVEPTVDNRVKYIEWRYHINNSTDTVYYQSSKVSQVNISNRSFGNINSNQRLVFYYTSPLDYKYYFATPAGDTSGRSFYHIIRREDGRIIQTAYPLRVYNHLPSGLVYLGNNNFDYARFDSAGNEVYRHFLGLVDGNLQLVEQYKTYDQKPNAFKNLCYEKWTGYAQNNNNIKGVITKVSGRLVEEREYTLQYDTHGRLISIEDTTNHDFAIQLKYDY